MLRIGIKYCGGCTPRYNRVGFMNAFKEKHPEFEYHTVNEDLTADYWLLVCGCGAACPERTRLIAKKEILVLDSPESFEGLEKRLL